MKVPKEYFLYVGNVYPHKNLGKLLQAFQKILRYKDTKILSEKNKNSPNILISQYPNISLVLVGAEDYFYKRLVDYVEKIQLAGKVIFWGQAEREELNLLYKNAIALVFPSLMEGFGLPAVEAMANGCLVLCSDIPVFHEVLGEVAVYFNPQDINDIANKLESVLKEPGKYEDLKAKSSEQIKRYSWEKLARQTLAVYEESLLK